MKVASFRSGAACPDPAIPADRPVSTSVAKLIWPSPIPKAKRVEPKVIRDWLKNEIFFIRNSEKIQLFARSVKASYAWRV